MKDIHEELTSGISDFIVIDSDLKSGHVEQLATVAEDHVPSNVV